MPEPRKLRVFMCHASQDKPVVRDLCRQLRAAGWIEPWLDEEKLLPGQEWDLEIEKAVEHSDVVLVCLSSHSVDKEGYIQKELRFVLNIAETKPEGAIFVVPLRLDDCPAPRRLRIWQYVDYFPRSRRAWAFQRLLESLTLRAGKLRITTLNPAEEQARREAEEKARHEKEAQEKARKERERKSIETRHVFPSPTGRGARGEGEKPPARKKRNLLLLGVGGVVVLAFMIAGITYLSQNLSAGTPLATPTDLYPNLFATSFLTDPMAQLEQFATGTARAQTKAALSIGSTMTSPKDGMVMVYVPAGEFVMGNSAEDASENCQKVESDCKELSFKDESPPHTVFLDGFWIDQTEVTNEMFVKFLNSVSQSTIIDGDGSVLYDNHFIYDLNCLTCSDWKEQISWDGKRFTVTPDYEKHPVVLVSWYGASNYCRWADRRLPTEAEWEKVASWNEIEQEKFVYPWGNVFDGQRLNFCDRNCSYERSDKTADDGYKDTAPVGNYLSGASSYGALDLAGNVSEWVADWFSIDYYSTSPYINPLAVSPLGLDDMHTIRNGSWKSSGIDVRSTSRTNGAASGASNSTGFRCAMDATP